MAKDSITKDQVGLTCHQIFQSSSTSPSIKFQLKPREKTAFDYSEKLKEKFSHHPQVKRISRHRHVPRMIYTQQKELGIIRASQRRK